ncbi:MAG: 1-deoxy-D-xylulose-5-phosphate reductoisomerase [Candidatus Gastranaerophilales bacterium]|nr:1-deoxy-D-xylulose-5-phosphate reductoisomerase [Candidatus Gastranaerophilales bacterium]
MKTISILGSTGSIGTQTLEVIAKLPDYFNIFGLSGGNNIELLEKQIKKFNPKIVCTKSEKSSLELKNKFPNIEFSYGEDGLCQIAQNKQNDMILIAVSGIMGLYPTLSAIENGIDIALANKETLVCAGSIVMKKAKENNVNILPVDSEHSAIHQCAKNFKDIQKLILTASGGPFREKSIQEMEKATLYQTLAHPRWSMGHKITVDSATLMNKGLEVIEAHHLFNVDYKNIEVVIHPQSIIHSAIEYKDGSIIAQMGLPSMHIPIQYALTYPQRIKGIKTNSFNFFQNSNLTFEKPDLNKFPCLKLAYEAGIAKGIYPAILNAANEEAVNMFLQEKIKLTDICKIVEKTLEKFDNIQTPSLNEILDTDNQTRNLVKIDYIKLARL